MLEVAGLLPGRVGQAFVDTARDAFTRGLHVASAVSAVGVILLALFVFATLRRARPAIEEDPGAEPPAGSGHTLVTSPASKEGEES